jgi:hypothetical protein
LGGFALNDAKVHPPTVDFADDFRKFCPKVEITDKQDTADFAVTLDEQRLLETLTGPANAPAYQLSVYSGGAGLLYTGGTQFL